LLPERLPAPTTPARRMPSFPRRWLPRVRMTQPATLSVHFSPKRISSWQLTKKVIEPAKNEPTSPTLTGSQNYANDQHDPGYGRASVFYGFLSRSKTSIRKTVLVAR